MGFDGFPAGKLKTTRIPDLFFSELLTQIDDLGELKVTLYVLHRIQHASPLRLIRRSEMLLDATLARGLVGQGRPLADALDDALRQQPLRLRGEAQKRSVSSTRAHEKAGNRRQMPLTQRSPPRC